MILFSKIPIIFFLFATIILKGQQDTSLFSLRNSERYADFLYENEKYDLAKDEYSRLYYLDKQNLVFQSRLLNSYNFSGDIHNGLSEAKNMYASDSLFPDTVAQAFLHLLFVSDYRYRTQVFLQSNNSFPHAMRVFYLSSNAFLAGDIDESKKILENESDSILGLKNLKTILYQDSVFKPRNKILAVSMSTIVPGLGKVYLGQWKDGLASFVYSSLCAWQAYSGFQKKGIKSFYGWAFASVGTGFYFGNIYGTGKAHRLRIQKHEMELENQVKNVVEASFK